MTNTLIITVDALPAYLLGPYGADNSRTPALDGLAAEGILFDRMYADSLCPSDRLTSVWTGQHTIQRAHSSGVNASRTFWQKAVKLDLLATFTTDCPIAADLAQLHGCSAASVVQSTEPRTPCSDVMQSSVLAPWITLAEHIAQNQKGGVHWLHSLGLKCWWDAPLELREKFADPEDPSPPDCIVPPELDCTDLDPDAIVGFGQVASAQAAIIDEGLGTLLAAIESRPDADDWNIVFATLGGFPLGESGHIGALGLDFHETHLACAGIISRARTVTIGRRLAQICQLPDLGATIDQLVFGAGGSEIDGAEPDPPWGVDAIALEQELALIDFAAEHSLALAVEGRSDADGKLGRWVRSPAWALRNAGTEVQLFAVPDDRWQVCDVASRRLDIVESLEKAAQQFTNAAKLGKRTALPNLDEDLTATMR